MFQLGLGTTEKYCDGVSRRSFLQIGATGFAGLCGLGLSANQAIGSSTNSSVEKIPGAEKTKDTSVILIWLDGGPSHMDLYDLKPEAPAEYRGIWKPIPTKVPGYQISELFPRQAKHTDKFSIVRSLYHNTGDHFAGAHRMLTSKDMGVGGASIPGKFPSLGAIVHRQIGSRQPNVPGYVAIPYGMSVGIRPGYFGGNFLGAQHDPFETIQTPNSANFQIRNLNLAQGLTLGKLEDRRSLLKHFDSQRKTLDRLNTTQAMDHFSQEAFDYIAGPRTRDAFDVSREDPKLRDRYGRHDWGQSALLARRLVEFGCSFVTIHLGGWDHHWNLKSGMENYLPKVDSMVASLFEDLESRGLLEKTLVVLCGEFSRTPRMNDGGNGGAPMSMGTPGRDHWGNSMFCLMGGGGVKGGMLYGSTDRLGQNPKDRPVTPCNIHATVYEVLGIDPKLQITDFTGRPTNILDDPTPISDLLG